MYIIVEEHLVRITLFLFMGFKEIRSYRQDGELHRALEMARVSYDLDINQRSASALFVALQNIVELHLERKELTEASALVNEMIEIMPHMGDLLAIAKDTLSQLQERLTPRYSEVMNMAMSLQKERNKYHLWTNSKLAFQKILEWYPSAEAIPTSLQEAIASIVCCYLSVREKQITLEDFSEGMSFYLSLSNKRPSALHNTILELARRFKKRLQGRFSFVNFFEQWGIQNFSFELWQKSSTKKNVRTLAEKVIHDLIKEVYDFDLKEKLASLYPLYVLAEEKNPFHLKQRLARARVYFMNGEVEKARLLYEGILKSDNNGRAWYELASTLTNPNDKELQLSAYAKACVVEIDDYQDYLLGLRLPLARLFLERKEYPNALRELKIYAQMSKEKGLSLSSDEYHSLLSQIPEGVSSDGVEKEMYDSYVRPIEEYIYGDLPRMKMIVVDVLAQKKKGQFCNTIVPMLKLRAVNGRTTYVSPRNSGVIRMSNPRGMLYDVTFEELSKSSTRAALLTVSQENPKAFFPTEYAYIERFSASQSAYIAVTSMGKERSIPAKEGTYTVGGYINYIHLSESTSQGVLEHILLPKVVEPSEAMPFFQIFHSVVVRVCDDIVYVVTEDGHRGTFPISLAPYPLFPGAHCTLRGYVSQREVEYPFQVLSL